MYLTPNQVFCKKGLRGGNITTKDGEYRKLSAVELKIMEKNIPGLKIRKIVVDNKPEVIEPEKTEIKPGSVEALRLEAEELGIDFNSKTKKGDLETLISEKKLELETEPETEGEGDE
jgi:hypothetical protein